MPGLVYVHHVLGSPNRDQMIMCRSPGTRVKGSYEPLTVSENLTQGLCNSHKYS